MGDSPVLATGVAKREEQGFFVQYVIRRFKRKTPVFCKWCGPQLGPPPAGNYDLAGNTLRAQFDISNYDRDPVEFSGAYDINPSTAIDNQVVYEFRRNGFDIGSDENMEGALLHLVLPPFHIPQVESIAPMPRYGWPYEDRFVIGWRGILSRPFYLSFKEVPAAYFFKAAESKRKLIERIAILNGEQKYPIKIKADTVIIQDSFNLDQTNINVSRYQQIWNRIEPNMDFQCLSQELSKLQEAMQKIATEPEQFQAIKAIVDAKKAATSEDGPAIVEKLKSAGKWAFGIAANIGTSVAAAAINASLGLK